MSFFSQRIPSNVAFPLSKTNNILTFSSQGTPVPVNHSLSYVELEVQLSNLGSAGYTDVCLGRGGNYYTPSAIVRNASLVETSSGKQYANLQYVNVLNQTLQYYNQGSASVVGGSILANGAGVYDPTSGDVLSTFNNTYTDDSIILRVPLSEVFPGDVGSSEALPLGSDVNYNLLLEPQYKLFQRVYPQTDLVPSKTTLGIAVNFVSVQPNTTTVTALAVGTVGNYNQNQTILVKFTESGVEKVVQRVITSITPDDGQTPGALVINTALTTTAPADPVQVIPYTNTNLYAFEPKTVDSDTYIFNTSKPRANLSIGEVMKCHVTLTDFTTSEEEEFYVKIVSLTPPTTGDITSITAKFINPGTLTTTNSWLVNGYLEPASDDLDSSSWTVTNAHLVLFHNNVNLKVPKKAVVSNWESQNVQMLKDTQLFRYNFQIRDSTFNALVFLNDGDTLFSQALGIDQYLLAVNEVPLTSVYMPLGSSLHQDNVMRCLDNSPVYKPNNLKAKKNDEIEESVEVCMIPGKIHRSSVNGEPMVQDGSSYNNFRVELQPKTLTQQCNVFVFCEKWASV